MAVKFSLFTVSMSERIGQQCAAQSLFPQHHPDKAVVPIRDFDVFFLSASSTVG